MCGPTHEPYSDCVASARPVSVCVVSIYSPPPLDVLVKLSSSAPSAKTPLPPPKTNFLFWVSRFPLGSPVHPPIQVLFALLLLVLPSTFSLLPPRPHPSFPVISHLLSSHCISSFDSLSSPSSLIASSAVSHMVALSGVVPFSRCFFVLLSLLSGVLGTLFAVVVYMHASSSVLASPLSFVCSPLVDRAPPARAVPSPPALVSPTM